MIEIKTTILRQIENNNEMYRDISFFYMSFYTNYTLYYYIKFESIQLFLLELWIVHSNWHI